MQGMIQDWGNPPSVGITLESESEHTDEFAGAAYCIDNFVHISFPLSYLLPLSIWRAYTMVKVSLRLIFTSLRYQFVSIRTYIYVFTFS